MILYPISWQRWISLAQFTPRKKSGRFVTLGWSRKTLGFRRNSQWNPNILIWPIGQQLISNSRIFLVDVGLHLLEKNKLQFCKTNFSWGWNASLVPKIIGLAEPNFSPIFNIPDWEVAPGNCPFFMANFLDFIQFSSSSFWWQKKHGLFSTDMRSWKIKKSIFKFEQRQLKACHYR